MSRRAACSSTAGALDELPVRSLRRSVGFVFQTPVMFAGTVRDNLEEAAALSDDPDRDLEGRLRTAMDRAELESDLLDRPGDRLSVGQQQRSGSAGPHPRVPEDPKVWNLRRRTSRRSAEKTGLNGLKTFHRYSHLRKRQVV
jgi:predicted ABC-type transport system involved in lysophospholipase L1 biosynthesis ATPase subunit